MGKMPTAHCFMQVSSMEVSHDFEQELLPVVPSLDIEDDEDEEH